MITPIYQLISSTIPPLESTHPSSPPINLTARPFLSSQLPFGQPSTGRASAFKLYLGRAEPIQSNLK